MNNIIELEKQLELSLKKGQRIQRLKVMGYIGLAIVFWIVVASLLIATPIVVSSWFKVN